VSGDGTLLFAGSTLPAVTVFGGTTPFVRDYYDALAPQSQGLLSVAAYPAKVCQLPTSLAATLDVSAGPPPSFSLNATFTLGSGGVDPLTQPVTLQIGNSFYTYSVTIPAGSFNIHRNGTNAGIYVFQGGINGATLKVQIAALPQNQFQITAFGKQVDLTGLANPLTVQVAIGESSASTSVNATMAEPLRGLWSAQ
jgi:hypothetical protein